MPLQVSGFAHLYRVNDGTGQPWQRSNANYFESAGRIAAVALIQSDYGTESSYPGNLEVVAHIGTGLKHFYRNPSGWFEGPVFYTGAAGIPAFIQGNYGTTRRNFEVVTPRATGGMEHLFRANDATQAWFPSPGGVFGTRLGPVDSVALIQSNYDRDSNYPGNLEVVAKSRGVLYHFYRNRSGTWFDNGPLPPIP
jgi:hypothetical protein